MSESFALDAWALLAYGWSPLAITHFALDAHNDALMLLFLLAAVWLMRRERPDLAVSLSAARPSVPGRWARGH